MLSTGLKNPGSQIQRIMEWVVQDVPAASPHIDDELIWFTGNTVEEMIRAHDPKQSYLFHMEVEVGGHIFRKGAR